MGDMGSSCAEAQVTAQHAALENLERRKSWSGFPKTLECEKVGGVLYNYSAAPRAPTFAISSSSSALTLPDSYTLPPPIPKQI